MKTWIDLMKYLRQKGELMILLLCGIKTKAPNEQAKQIYREANKKTHRCKQENGGYRRTKEADGEQVG